jgi:ribosome-binding factor A
VNEVVAGDASQSDRPGSWADRIYEGITMKAHRLARVAEVVREVAATTILFELRDPRVKNVTVTRAEVSADLQHAKVYVSIMGTEKEQKLAMYGLESAAGFIQTKVAKQLTSRYVPHVTFVLDPGVKKSIEIARLIREAKAGMPTTAPTDADSDTATSADQDDLEQDDVDESAPTSNDTSSEPSSDSRH